MLNIKEKRIAENYGYVMLDVQTSAYKTLETNDSNQPSLYDTSNKTGVQQQSSETFQNIIAAPKTELSTASDLLAVFSPLVIHLNDKHTSAELENSTNTIKFADNHKDNNDTTAVDRHELSKHMSALIVGTSGSDTILGTEENDSILAYGGNDIVFSFGGSDTINGGAGNDTINAGVGADYIIGGSGDDYLLSGWDSDNNVNLGNDFAKDTIYGGAGNDYIDVGAGDYASGGLGNDRIHVHIQNEIATDAATVVGGDGNDIVLILEEFTGELSALNFSYTYLGEGNNVFYGGYSSDYITAGNGSDYIDASLGNNTVYAGGGDDLVYTGVQQDIVYAGDGNDFVVDFNGGAGFEALNDTFYGGNGDDTLIGHLGNDFLFGGAGNDMLSTGAGNNQVADGGSGNDILFVNVEGSVQLPQMIDIEAISLTNFSGSPSANVLQLKISTVLNASSTTNTLIVTSGDADDVLDIDLASWTQQGTGIGYDGHSYIKYVHQNATLLVSETILVI